MKKYVSMVINALLTVFIVIISLWLNNLLQGDENNWLLLLLIFLVVYIVVFVVAILIHFLIKKIKNEKYRKNIR